MSNEEENKEIVRGFWETVYGDGETSAVPEFFTSDATIHFGHDSWGVSEYEEYLGSSLKAFSDYSITIEDIFADGDKVALRVSDSGKFEEEWNGIQPTGNEFSHENLCIAYIEDGKISYMRYETDTLSLMEELGIME